MAKRVVFLHTMLPLAGLFGELATQLLDPATTEVAHLVDELLLKEVLAQGTVTDTIRSRLLEHAQAADAFGANLLMVTCSSLAPALAGIQPSVLVPLLRLDQPMIDRALELGTRIGVAATAYTTLGPTTEFVYERAAQLGKSIFAEPVLCDGAYAALGVGDLAAHDRIVRETIADLSQRSDVVILAQASMARVTATLPDDITVPVLSSPRLAVEAIRDALG